MPLIDVSRPLVDGGPHWPGDQDIRFRLVSRIAEGRSCNVGHLSLSVHSGTHVDAPFHYNDRGATIESLAPDLFIGPARVIDARGEKVFTEKLFAGVDFRATPRILLRTDTWTDSSVFPTAWPLLDRGLPAWLGERGVRLLGLDVPSVDTLTNTDMAIHHLLDEANILILESLDLHTAPAGIYELIALPLKLQGADGSPVRAVLRR
jgi:arylformamidase